jgi:hypothetical protein
MLNAKNPPGPFSPKVSSPGDTKEVRRDDQGYCIDALTVEMLEHYCRNGEVRFLETSYLELSFPKSNSLSTQLRLQVMSVYRVLEHAPPGLVNAPSSHGSAPIFEAVAGRHW